MVVRMVVRMVEVTRQPAVGPVVELGRRQRMETLGLLAAGVAHDVNNLLTVIANYAAMATEPRTEPGPPDEADWLRVVADMEHIRNAAVRGSSLTGQLLAFARPAAVPQAPEPPLATVDRARPALPMPAPVPAACAVNTVVTETVTLVRASICRQIEVVVELDQADPTVAVDAGALTQVLVNLMVNARDAIEGRGTIRVRTRVVDRAMVQIEVEDTGHGIPVELVDRVFEPFFSTKAAGSGSGLGLPMVYEIVTSSGGRVLIDSPAGDGASDGATGRGPALTELLPAAA